MPREGQTQSVEAKLRIAIAANEREARKRAQRAQRETAAVNALKDAVRVPSPRGTVGEA